VKSKLFGIFIIIIISSTLVFPSGFSISEGGARAVGMGNAFVAVADNISTIFYNPGGAPFLDKTEILVGGYLLSTSNDFSGANPYPGEGVEEEAISQQFIIPNVYAGTKLGKRIFLGFGLSVPYGLGAKWDDNWSGKYISTNTEVQAFDLTPTIGFKISKNISIGASYIYRVSKVFTDKKIPFVDPFTFQVKDVAFLHMSSDYSHADGYRVGALLKTGNFNFGLSYMSKIKINYEGNAKFDLIPTGNQSLDTLIAGSFPKNETPGETSMVFPALITAGVAMRLDDGFTLSAQAELAKWSQYKELKIEFNEYPQFSQTIEKYYKDTYIFRFGAEKKVSDKFTVRAGYYFDPPANELKSLGPDLPDSTKHGICFGLSYKLGKILVDFGNTFLIFEDRSTSGENLNNFNGSYSSFIFISGINISFKI